MPRGAKPTALQRAEGAHLWMRRRGVLAGQSAAAVLGAKWIDGEDPVEVIYGNRNPPELLTVHTERLRGLPHLRRILPLVGGGAESPQETLARLILVDAGLP